ncbi:MAG: hypothetical protein A2868_03780 [Candidatus Levybacteria bacterium RIFCSPHIGHO2_01_FULL_40_15b]|nr:MAG: hypothetical protein A2868_03780 [Candidatus Levybacteria bacterium RIFCSPHIGHO2_01_FULL_40_15b]
MTNGKSNKINSSHVRFGRRTYFFDVNEKNDKKYLKITESKWMGEGKDRIYNSFVLFPEEVENFQKNLSEVAGYLT